jgi:hypothetical protein
MFPAPISFLNNKLKVELGMKTKKDEEETDDAKFCSLKVPMDHEEKESKNCVVKVKKYDSGIPEEFLKWRLILNEQTKTNGYAGKYDMIMNLAQAMLAGRSLEAFLTERRSQESQKESTRPRIRLYIPPIKFMIMPFLNWQFVLLTSKVDGEMPMIGRENTREEIFSWANSTQKSSVKDCKTLPGIWILFLLRKQVTRQDSQGIWKVIARR